MTVQDVMTEIEKDVLFSMNPAAGSHFLAVNR